MGIIQRLFGKEKTSVVTDTKSFSQPQVERITNEGLAMLFPECTYIKCSDIEPLIQTLFEECKDYREINEKVKDYCWKYYPRPDTKSEEYDTYLEYYHKVTEWIKHIEREYVERKGYRHPFDEACLIAAHEWAKMIFGVHVQNNGDKTPAGDFLSIMGTLAKEKAKKDLNIQVVGKFITLMTEYYKNGCKDERVSGYSIDIDPYCDYYPNSPLRNILIKSGVNKEKVEKICPWKTGISIDEIDYAVKVRRYQTVEYI